MAHVVRAMSAALPACVVALSGCAAGGTPVARSALAAQRPAAATATLTVTVPAGRSVRYVSPSSNSVRVESYTVTGDLVANTSFATTVADLNATVCVGSGPRVCSIPAAAPVGRAAFGVTLYDAAGGGGHALAAIAPSAGQASTIVADGANVLQPLTLLAIPYYVTLAATGTLTAGTPSTIPVTVTAQDAGHNALTGTAPYYTPIALTASDVSGATTFSGTVTSPASTVNLLNSGNVPSGNATSVIVSASAPGLTAANVTTSTLAFSPAALALACPGGCTSLANGPSPLTVTLSESGNAGGTVALAATGAGCTVVPTAVPMSGGVGSADVYANPAGGTCALTATDAFGQHASAAPSFVAAGPPTVLASPPCPPAFVPADPSGGTLSPTPCGGASTTVRYGSYTAIPFDTTASTPGNNSFVLATYASLTQPALKVAVYGPARLVVGVNVLSTAVQYVSSDGDASVPFTQIPP